MWNTDYMRRWVAAEEGKYGSLFKSLAIRRDYEWRTTFRELEEILGFDLPASARRHRPWWGNMENGGEHCHSLAWTAAGWKISSVDMAAETLVFIRPKPQVKTREKIDISKEFPSFHTHMLDRYKTFSREEMYED